MDRPFSTDLTNLPLVKEGESKVVYYLGHGKVLIKLKPTVYSYTHNRAGTVPGSDELRLESCRIFSQVFAQAGLSHTYCGVAGGTILSRLVYEPSVFEPPDLLSIEVAVLPRFCPVEVVVKRRHVGTPKHRYHGIENHLTRYGRRIEPDGDYPELICRFDWRNPNTGPNGERMCDEVMDASMADWWIDTHKARRTAFDFFNCIGRFLMRKGLVLDDICFFISQCGNWVFSEVTPDCMRVRLKDDPDGSLDKDVWRAGGSSPLLLEKWRRFVDMIEGPDVSNPQG